METSRSFDLNDAISAWREAFTRTTALSSENLRELECHLRDSVGELRAAGLTEEEAFLISSRRLGRPESLADEFDRANDPDFAWTAHFVWILSGIFCFEICKHLIRITSLGISLAVKDAFIMQNSPQWDTFRFVVLMGTSWLVLPMALWMTWLFASRIHSKLRDLLNKGRAYIAVGAIFVCALPLLLQACENALNGKFYARPIYIPSPGSWWPLLTMQVAMFSAVLVVPVAILLLLRRRKTTSISLNS